MPQAGSSAADYDPSDEPARRRPGRRCSGSRRARDLLAPARPARCGRSRRARVGGRLPHVALDRSRERRQTSAAPTAPSAAVPEIASLADLRALADSGETFYWAGVRSGTRIELAASDGTVFIRYLPPGEPAGSTAPALTVATYPRANAFDEVSRAAEDEDATQLELPRGGLAVAARRAARTSTSPTRASRTRSRSTRPGSARPCASSRTGPSGPTPRSAQPRSGRRVC